MSSAERRPSPSRQPGSGRSKWRPNCRGAWWRWWPGRPRGSRAPRAPVRPAAASRAHSSSVSLFRWPRGGSVAGVLSLGGSTFPPQPGRTRCEVTPTLPEWSRIRPSFSRAQWCLGRTTCLVLIVGGGLGQSGVPRERPRTSVFVGVTATGPASSSRVLPALGAPRARLVNSGVIIFITVPDPPLSSFPRGSPAQPACVRASPPPQVSFGAVLSGSVRWSGHLAGLVWCTVCPPRRGPGRRRSVRPPTPPPGPGTSPRVCLVWLSRPTCLDLRPDSSTLSARLLRPGWFGRPGSDATQAPGRIIFS